MQKRLKDHVRYSNQEVLIAAFSQLVDGSRKIKHWMDENLQRTEHQILFGNLLASSADYLDIAKQSSSMHISVLALSTRSLYEMNIRLRIMLDDESEISKWASELATDKVEVLKGILELDPQDQSADKRAFLENEIVRLKEIVRKHNLPKVTRPEGAYSIAKRVGLEREHKGLFKLFSKLVHPSSFLVNHYEGAASDENRMILQIHAQLYAIDTIQRICAALSVPAEISAPYGCQQV